MHRRSRFVVFAGTLALSAVLSPDASAGGASTQSHLGLTCHNKWSDTKGETKCSGNAAVKWRLHVACQFQPDYDGPWQQGGGSDAFECNSSVQSASVQWG